MLNSPLQQALNSIAPSWPLDSAVAINPHWQRISKPIDAVANRLALLADFNVLPTRAYLKTQWQSGRIRPEHLQQALTQSGQAFSLVDCLNALDEARPAAMPLVVDLLDAAKPSKQRLPWRGAITFQLSQSCAAYFDQDQAHWQPLRQGGLYEFWLDTLTHDRGTATVMGLPKLNKALAELPAQAEPLLATAQALFGFTDEVWQAYLEALLLSINGWASWCAWLKFEADKQQQPEQHLYELLAMRLAWELMLLKCFPELHASTLNQLQQQWLQFPTRLQQQAPHFALDLIWQNALELGFEQPLLAKLAKASTAATTTAKTAAKTTHTQMIFCIDIRSEPMRRAIESTQADIETRAYAGFFGLPMAYQPLGSHSFRPQLPGLACATVQVTDEPLPNEQKFLHKRQQQLAAGQQWNNTVTWPNSTFSFVEAVGVGYLPRIWRWLKPSQAALKASTLRPRVQHLSALEKAKLAANALETMGLVNHFARLVVLVGHASHSTNNAHSSTLDCGACGGQSGEANVRAMAALLNEAEVRSELHTLGIDIPASTQFMPALHCTTTDEITGFELDTLSPMHLEQWQNLHPSLAQAGDQARRERAITLAMQAQGSEKAVLKRFRKRANDGSQTRPEWGLTGNAGFIIGPRALTAAGNFSRCYLHDYQAQEDPDFSILERLMTGPLLVTHWLNMQYHASTVDPLHYGSGNKVLHNVVGGHIGVFEGNGGDLRIGLPKQSLFDGSHWRHEPLRQTTLIAAPQAAIDTIIAKHPVLQQLVNNQWLKIYAV